MSELPNSIREINQLPPDEKCGIYNQLIPEWVYSEFSIDPVTANTQGHIQQICPSGSRALELSIRRNPADRDPILYINMADTFNNQILVLLVVVNDPDSQRFNVDVDEYGNRTNFGTTSRNVPAEIAAKKNGLSPGQIRKGLRSFSHSVPVFEDFVERMGHTMFFIEPLAYHNAILFEKYGFNYLRGLKDMHQINANFQAGGELHHKLDGRNPFRLPEAVHSVRGRSWAIHDGILGHPFTGFQMYKRLGKHAGINTFPDRTW